METLDITANPLLIAVALLLLFKIIVGYKKGLVREVVSVISLVFLCIVAVLVGNGLHSYLNGEILKVVLFVVLLLLLSVAHHFLGVILLPAKLLAKLPVIRSLDKLLGIVMGVLETVVVLWMVYTFIMIMDMGMAGTFIMECTADSPILTWLYEHNQLAGWVERLGVEFGLAALLSAK